MTRRRPPDRVRISAASILGRWQREHRHVEDLVESAEQPVCGKEWTWAERRRLRELVYSCVRLRGRYDHILSRRSRKAKPPAPELRAILWIALHELVELGHAQHAVVDEAVRSTVANGFGYARGYVNGLLRGVVRDGVEQEFCGPEDPAGYATTWLSHPEWLVRRWIDRLGPEAALRLCAANNERPRLYLRAGEGRGDALAEALRKHGWESEAVEALPDARELLTRVPPALLLEQVDEACVFQDAAAQLVAPLLASAKPVRVLDLCAAPEGKATHVADLLPEATIVAADLAARRLHRLEPTLERLELRGRVHCVVGDAALPPFRPGSFDAVLLDAPCTGTGVLARRHDARWNRRPEDLAELPRLQRVLLDAALDLVRPGGTVVYSTCSLEAEENDEVVDFILGQREDVTEWGVAGEVDARFLRDGRLATSPQEHGIDGAFAARLRRRADGES